MVGSLSEYLASNFYWVAREYQYRNIKPRILIEELIEDGHADGPLDYRFWGFEGKPEIIQVDNRPHNINPFYDVDLNYGTESKRRSATFPDRQTYRK